MELSRKKSALFGLYNIAKRIMLVICDIFSIFFAYFFTIFFRSQGQIDPEYMAIFFYLIVPILIIYIACFANFHLYSSLWEHASIEELIQTVLAVLVGCLVSALYIYIVESRFLSLTHLVSALIMVLMVGGLRMGYRTTRRILHFGHYRGGNAKRALIIGAGTTGSMIVKQMFDTHYKERIPVAIVDDDLRKKGARIHRVRIMGTTKDIPKLATKLKIDEIVYCIPSASAKERKRILEICVGTRCELKIIPGIEAMLEGVSLLKMRDVDISELLDREEVQLDIKSISEYLTGSTILVTGGGGSIGSEICRQVASFHPAKLIIFDIYENNAYELYVDLRHQYKDALDVEVVIGSVRDAKRLSEVFARYKPDVVFHAAAHKHVPLMELNPAEAVKNNVFGTLNVAEAANTYKAKRFVLISTDKAVNPTSIMGATKYLCELIVQYMNVKSECTRYVAVRFGNVLGSNGSVIPLFRRQIAVGGPVTVTHKDMMRYFMTIPEAAKLVIQAGSMAEKGQIFILDMGEPVSIDAFARSFIRLSGYEPDVDIKIEYTGLRPGEKMYEELFQETEDVFTTDFKGIIVGKVHNIAPEEIKRRLDWLKETINFDTRHISEYLTQIVPTYLCERPEEKREAKQEAV